MKLLSTCFLLLLSTALTAQLGGSYTVGSISSDFLNPLQAINELDAVGTSDTVTFLIEDGVYIEDYDFSSIHLDHPVFIVGANGVQSNVILRSTGISFGMHSCWNLRFKHLTFDANGGTNAVDAAYCNNLQFDSCTFMGSTNDNLSMVFCEGLTIVRGCHFVNEDARICGGGAYSGLVEGNIFGASAHFLLGISTVRNNSFFWNAHIRSNTEFYNNVCLHGGVSSSHDTNINVHDNIFYGSCSIAFTTIVKFWRNQCFGTLGVSFGHTIDIYNNYFHGLLSIGLIDTPSLKLHANNFGVNSLFYPDYSSIQIVANNNFSQPIVWSNAPIGPAYKVKNNNYWPEAGSAGIQVSHINPEYVSNELLEATNPLLNGLGFAMNLQEDINGNPRPAVPTIGANELCMDADTVTISCGQLVGTHLCTSALIDGFTVEPSEYVESSNLDFPLLRPDSTTQFYFLDISGMIVDSILVIVESFQFDLGPDLSINCGYPAILFNTAIPTGISSITWESEETILQYGSYMFYSYPDSTASYYASLTYDGCGTISDTLVVNVEQFPHALFTANFGFVDSLIFMNNYSSCADSFEWYFGDGATSNEFEPIHIYTSPGLYLVELIAIKDSFVDNYYTYVLIDFPTTLEDNSDQIELNVYPNPVSDYIQFTPFSDPAEVLIFNISGQAVLIKKINPFESSLDLSSLLPGIYALTIRTDHSVVTAKFIVAR